ncbi:DUF4830 domain-containing protein [Paenibacillus silvae]|uniref:DUF4830 domain-containing protein n=1 Tax=Paenibacillus silvae TaxID=1325358 RepID=UPI002004D336|nr:DUF4830 domain-containing protein [Paenibacillus silvae]
MMRITKISVLIGLLFLVLSACGNGASDDEKNAEQYLKQYGYQITSRQGQVEKYILEKSKLSASTENIPYQQSWGVQSVEPDKYFGKEITIYQFTVRNHPLEKKYNTQTTVNVFLCEGNVIGGASMPARGNAVLMGAPYSLEGQTLEEINKMSYKEWSEKWKMKYGS